MRSVFSERLVVVVVRREFGSVKMLPQKSIKDHWGSLHTSTHTHTHKHTYLKL